MTAENDLLRMYKKQIKDLKQEVRDLRKASVEAIGVSNEAKKLVQKERENHQRLQKKMEEQSVDFLAQREKLNYEFARAERRYMRAESIVRSLSKSLHNSADAIKIMTKG